MSNTLSINEQNERLVMSFCKKHGYSMKQAVLKAVLSKMEKENITWEKVRNNNG